MELSKKALEQIESNSKLKNRLLIESGVHFTTVYRWIENNDENLTRASILKIIREETGLTDAEILTEKTTAA